MDATRRREADGQTHLPAGAEGIESGTNLLKEGDYGTGGVLTVAEEELQQLAANGAQCASADST